jgi:hypothetical protein
VTQTYLSSQAITAPFVPREASAAGRLRSNAETGEVGPGTCHFSNAKDLMRSISNIPLAPQPFTPSGIDGRNLSYRLNAFFESCSGRKALRGHASPREQSQAIPQTCFPSIASRSPLQ